MLSFSLQHFHVISNSIVIGWYVSCFLYKNIFFDLIRKFVEKDCVLR